MVRIGGVDPKKIQTIYYGVNGIYESRNGKGSIWEALSINRNTFLIATVARLIPRKGHRTVLEALRLILKERQDVHLLIVGDGIERKALEEYSRK